MAVFTTSWSNIRTAGLTNPCPVGSQICCSIQPGSPPIQLHQATALFGTHTWRDKRPSAVLATPCQNICPLAVPPDPWPPGSLPPIFARPQPGADHTAHWDTCPFHQTHCSSGPAEPQLCMGWQEPTPPISPCLAPALSGTTGAPTYWDRHHPGVRQLHPPACKESCSLCRAGTSATGFPDNHCAKHLLSCH
jgi:hypothetical protein